MEVDHLPFRFVRRVAMLLSLLLPVSIAIGKSIPAQTNVVAMPDGTLLKSGAPAPSAPALDLRRPAPTTVRAAAPTAAPSVGAEPVLVQQATTRPAATFTLRATAYNSLRGQTDSTPFVTATGARTRWGVVALSRDMLRRIPYGSKIKIEDLGSFSSGRGRGAFNRTLSQTVFVVEDTMHPRKSAQVDVWFPARSQALSWGVRKVRITVLELGRRSSG